MRYFLLLSVAWSALFVGCGPSTSSSSDNSPRPAAPRTLEPDVTPVSLEDFQSRQIMVRLTGQQSTGNAPPTDMDNTIMYTLTRDKDRVVASLNSLTVTNPTIALRKGANIQEMASAYNIPESKLRKVVDTTFTDPFCLFQIGRQGQEVTRDVVAHREAILLLSNNSVGVMSIFLAPIAIEEETWKRQLAMPMGHGITFRGEVEYRLRDRQFDTEGKYVDVVLGGTLSADGPARVMMSHDMGVALRENRPARRELAQVSKSRWRIQGYLRYSRADRHWISGQIRTSIAMQVQTGQNTTTNSFRYVLEILSSLPVKQEGS